MCRSLCVALGLLVGTAAQAGDTPSSPLDEAELVLQGKKLLPHWRVKDGRGINLKRVFEEPRTFDLVLWVHGAATLPYLEEGTLVTRQTANSLNAVFQGRFLAFAVWFQ